MKACTWYDSLGFLLACLCSSVHPCQPKKTSPLSALCIVVARVVLGGALLLHRQLCISMEREIASGFKVVFPIADALLQPVVGFSSQAVVYGIGFAQPVLS